MQVKFFTIPIIGGEQINEEMNLFLRSHQVLQTDFKLITNSIQKVLLKIAGDYPPVL